VRKILSVLPIEKYDHNVIVLHQMDLSTTTPTQILRKINTHEMYMHINDKRWLFLQEEDLALEENQEKKGKTKILVEEETSSDDDLDDVNSALMVNKTTKMLKWLNREGIKFDSRKKKFFFSSKRKSISEMDSNNYGELGHLAHQSTKPKKNKFKGKKMMRVEMIRRKRNSSRKKMASKRNSTRENVGKHTPLMMGSPTLNLKVA
jgi:NADH dehydrogenase/NADH:ubiquinone oxidoreductase subunit G